MTHLIIDNKKYVLIAEENYRELQRVAALKHNPEKIFSIEEARNYSKSLIRKWASDKQFSNNLLPNVLLKYPGTLNRRSFWQLPKNLQMTLMILFIGQVTLEKGYRTCREPIRDALGYKCIPKKKKYTIVFVELDTKLSFASLFFPKEFIGRSNYVSNSV